MERTIERREQNLAKTHTHTHKTDSVLELEEKGNFGRLIKVIDRNIHIQMGTGQLQVRVRTLNVEGNVAASRRPLHGGHDV